MIELYNGIFLATYYSQSNLNVTQYYIDEQHRLLSYSYIHLRVNPHHRPNLNLIFEHQSNVSNGTMNGPSFILATKTLTSGLEIQFLSLNPLMYVRRIARMIVCNRVLEGWNKSLHHGIEGVEYVI